LQPGARFCHNCGQAVEGEISVSTQAVEAGSQAGPPTQPQDPGSLLQRFIPKNLLSKLEAARQSQMVAGERRVVTILFCDVKGSTQAASSLDPEEWAEIINGAFEPMIRPVYRYEGIVARLQGDGLLAFFGAPIAHEDDPQRAVLAGLEILSGIQAYGEEVRRRWGIDFNVRVGINTGLVVVGAVGSDLRVEYTALGDAINLAARMEQSAEPGRALVAEPTYRLVAPLFDFEGVEGLQIKGKERPVKAYYVLGTREQPGRLRGIEGLNAPLIGRQSQLQALREAVEMLARGQGSIVSVIGEAGLGKSRLVAEFRREVETGIPFPLAWLEGRIQSYEAMTPFALFSNLFNHYFGIQARESEAERYERVESRLAELFGERSVEMASFFGMLLGLNLEEEAALRVKYLEPPQVRDILFLNVRKLVEKSAGDQPTVLYLDDLHWADPISIELLESLLPLVERVPLMILTAYRPLESEPSWSFHEKVQREYLQRHRVSDLQPLGEAEARALVAGLLHIEDLPEDVRQNIVVKAEGNPFFVEEIIRSLLDAGLVVKVGGRWKATREIREIQIPDTLLGVITARLDRLDEASKHIAQAAAVLGREFRAELLSEMVEAKERFVEGLAELQQRELVNERSNTLGAYLFKHGLTQEAAYNSILLSNRRELHLRAAEALIRREPDAVSEIARHLVEARQALRAAPYLLQSGDRAARAYATLEAIGYYRQVLELKDALEDIHLVQRAYEGLGGAYSYANRVPEAETIFQEMLDFARKAGAVAIQISALNKLARVRGFQLGQFQEAEQMLEQANNLADLHNENSGVPESALIACQMCTIKGEFEEVTDHMERVIAIGREMGSNEYMALGLDHTATSLLYMNRIEEAWENAQKGLEIARQLEDPIHRGILLAEPVAYYHLQNGDFAAARAALIEALEIGTKIGELGIQAISAYLLAEMARWQGEYESALAYGRRSLEAALPLEPYMPFFVVPSLGSLGMVYLEISEQFRDKVGEVHQHALRLLENPAGTLTGSQAWSCLAYCAITLGDHKMAEDSIAKGLNTPNMYMYLERPHHLAGAALLASAREEHDEATRRAEEARAYAEEHGLRHVYPLMALVRGKVLVKAGQRQPGLEWLEKAEGEGLGLGLRPVVWQARAETARVLAGMGEVGKAAEKREDAEATAMEIAALFQDEELRAAYLRNVLPKIHFPT
jgi:predicted ATPase/class 3 adenylate cyclase